MADQQNLHHSIVVNLFVKGTDRQNALNTVAAKLNDWYTEHGSDHFIDGFGYPFGSLLLWGYLDKEVPLDAPDHLEDSALGTSHRTGAEAEILSIGDRTHSG